MTYHPERPDLYYQPDFLQWCRGESRFEAMAEEYERKAKVSAWDTIDAFAEFQRNKFLGISNDEILLLFGAFVEDIVGIDEYYEEILRENGSLKKMETELCEKYGARES